ncbi:MAG TPA: hypothetical protein VNQ76_06045 [Planctomicrobium sp.]|nr:hypothetical protein [Planctomicrobium sp.]
MAKSGSVHIGLRQEIVRHTVKAIESTPVSTDPFPHFHVTGFFPDKVYQRLLDSLPDVAHYQVFGYEKHHNDDQESNRRRFCLVQSALNELPADIQEFWYTLRSVLGSVAIKEAVFQKLNGGLSYRYSCSPDKARSLEGYALPELFHETQGYQIKPHPDTRKKVVTMQIALPEDAGGANLGTEFYRRSLNPASWLRSPKGFDIVKTMPFVPNAAYAFVVLNTIRLKSWHGRSVLNEACGVRNSILNIWYEKAEHANTEIVEENQMLFPTAKAA